MPTATPQPLNHKRQLLDAFPTEFDRQTYLAVTENSNIPDIRAEKQISRFVDAGLMVRQAHGTYSNTATEKSIFFANSISFNRKQLLSNLVLKTFLFHLFCL